MTKIGDPTAERDPEDGAALMAELARMARDFAVTTDEHGDGWIPCHRLLEDPATLAETVERTKELRNIERDDLAMSFFVIGYATRVALAAIAVWVLADRVLDVSPEVSALALVGPKPTKLGLNPTRLTNSNLRSVEQLHKTLVDGHLALLVEAARGVCRIGENLLWGNVGSACAYSFEKVARELPVPLATVGDRVVTFFDSSGPEVAASGQLTPFAAGWMWERKSCCGWYLVPEGSHCADCPKLAPDQHGLLSVNR